VFKGSGFYSTDHRATKGMGTAKKSEDKNSEPSSEKDSTNKKKESSKES
jgi:predicted nucleic acid-binding Zn ribbon protein